MTRARITGVGAFLPKRILTNADLEKMVDTNDEWIVQRTGIRERRIVDENEATSDLAVRAAQQALERANLLPEDMEDPELGEAFFFPYINRVAMDLTVTGAAEPVVLKLQYGLPAGPFDDASRPDFLSRLAQAHADVSRPLIMKGLVHP